MALYNISATPVYVMYDNYNDYTTSSLHFSSSCYNVFNSVRSKLPIYIYRTIVVYCVALYKSYSNTKYMYEPFLF